MYSAKIRNLLLAVLLAALVACADQQDSREGVVEIDYRSDVISRKVKRRLDLMRAGVRLRGELAIARVWRNAMRYTFIARRPDGEETGVAALRRRCRGVPVSGKIRGIRRQGWMGNCRVVEGYWIVDVFSSLDTYLTSAVAPETMPFRHLLQHLGIARELSSAADRVLMTPEERIYWRELLPVVRANRGYGPLFIPAREHASDESAEEGTLKVMGTRYELEEVGDFVLVGQDRGEERCRHVFTIGGGYLMSILQYGVAEFDGRQALRELGLESSEPLPHDSSD
jgi:hypothetical protein